MKTSLLVLHESSEWRKTWTKDWKKNEWRAKNEWGRISNGGMDLVRYWDWNLCCIILCLKDNCYYISCHLEYHKPQEDINALPLLYSPPPLPLLPTPSSPPPLPSPPLLPPLPLSLLPPFFLSFFLNSYIPLHVATSTSGHLYTWPPPHVANSKCGHLVFVPHSPQQFAVCRI